MVTREDASAIALGGETNDAHLGCSRSLLGQGSYLNIVSYSLYFGFFTYLKEERKVSIKGYRSCGGGMLRTSAFGECVGRDRNNVETIHVVSRALDRCTTLLSATPWDDPEAEGNQVSPHFLQA